MSELKKDNIDNDDDDDDEVVNELEGEEVIIKIDPKILPDDLNDRPNWLLYIGSIQTSYISPIDISIGRTEILNLNQLKWCNYDAVPRKIKFTNTGYTLILCANWEVNIERPYIQNGPLSNKYVFSQLHFHWGQNDMEGSEHSIDGMNYPIEMHIIHYNEKYGSQENALNSLDGLCVVVYLFQLQSEFNKKLQTLLDYFKDIKHSNTSVIIKNYSLIQLIEPFVNDYLLYWGSIVANYKIYPLMWLICRQPKPITMEQIQYFREIFDINGDKLLRNFHPTINQCNQVNDHRRIFHINRTPYLISTLLPIRIFAEKK